MGYDTKYAGHTSRQIPHAPSLEAMGIEIYLCYLRKHLLHGGPVDVALGETQLSDIVTAGTTTASGQIFHQAILSFALILFGARHRQDHITRQGYAIHGVALRQLNHALSDSKCYSRDEVIISVVTLTLMESFVPSGQKNYLKHIRGLERLLELRDPSFYKSSESSKLHRGIGYMILFASLITGRASILEREEWKTALRVNCSDEEMKTQDLFDVLADCTAIISERNNMLANPESNLESTTLLRDAIEQKALALLTHLRDWKRLRDSEEETTYYETSESQPFLSIYAFPNESTATMIMFYNTALIYVLRVLASLLPEKPAICPNQNFTQGSLPNVDYIAEERLAAVDICRCLPQYLIQKPRDSGAPPAVHFALTTAWMTLHGKESAEGRWMMDLLNSKGQEALAKGLLAA
jgi:hypothetical protein